MTILQIDREAAAKWLEILDKEQWRIDRQRLPDAPPTPLIEAFANHREQATRDLIEALRALERNTVALYRGIAPGGNYGVNAIGINANESTFADADPVVVAARLALTKATTND